MSNFFVEVNLTLPKTPFKFGGDAHIGINLLGSISLTFNGSSLLMVRCANKHSFL